MKDVKGDFMLPIPTHLNGVLIPVGEDNSENKVTGIIRCSCGNQKFRVDNNIDEPTEDYSQVIKCFCTACGKGRLLFDDKKHGWDGFVCHGEWMGESAPDEALSPHQCRECKEEIHEITVVISSQGKQDFIEESGIADGEAEFKEEDWVEAFDWIDISLKCSNCGCEEEQWLDLETM
ncbi:MAG: hypothetical protein LBS74_07690 [Oscillospiraceae bacterium]|jgi:hypothetical protein|nr:hypothetical protein [Oscillospiraceae bacterium]